MEQLRLFLPMAAVIAFGIALLMRDHFISGPCEPQDPLSVAVGETIFASTSFCLCRKVVDR